MTPKEYHYKGFTTIVEYDEEDKVYYGKIESIGDLVNFESESLDTVVDEFIAAVDEYLKL